ncbi:MAG: hypothetical protein IID28_04125 [Planctomycetes bacterium]|nr:hypothetical protein [Planctomycetota bacterium]
MEALMASAILFAGVLAVITAIMGGQHKALEAHRRMDAALAGEELMWQLAAMDTGTLLALPAILPAGPLDEFDAELTLEPVDHDLPGPGVIVRGTHVHIRIPPAFTGDPLLVELDLFIPEPQEP